MRLCYFHCQAPARWPGLAWDGDRDQFPMEYEAQEGLQAFGELKDTIGC